MLSGESRKNLWNITVAIAWARVYDGSSCAKLDDLMTREMTPVEWLESRALNRPRDMARGLFVRELLELIDDADPREITDSAMCWHAEDCGDDECLCQYDDWQLLGYELPPPPEDFTLGPEYPTALEPASV